MAPETSPTTRRSPHSGPTSPLLAVGAPQALQPPGAHEVLPAAHSMDTAWFAVDADGHVALLDSGENGPVAEHAHATDWPQATTELLQARLEADLSTLRGSLEGITERVLVDPGRGTGWEPVRSDDDLHALFEAILWFRSGASLAAGEHSAWHHASQRITTTSGEELVRLEQPDAWELEMILDGLERDGMLERALLSTHWVLEPHHLGLFEHGDGPGGAYDSYQPLARPRHPVRITDLPEGIRHAAFASRMLESRFGTTPLAPGRYFRCRRYRMDAVEPAPPTSRTTPPIPRDGLPLLASVLADPSGAPVLADWLLERDHPLAVALARPDALYPTVLSLLPAALQIELGCALVEEVLPGLDAVHPEVAATGRIAVGLARSGSASGPPGGRAGLLQGVGAWLSDGPTQDHASALRDVGAWRSLLAVQPRLDAIAHEASWMSAYLAGPTRWEAGRQAAEAEHLERALALLEARI